MVRKNKTNNEALLCLCHYKKLHEQKGEMVKNQGPATKPNLLLLVKKSCLGKLKELWFQKVVDQLTGYRIIDSEVLKSVLEVIASCPKCDSKVKLLQTKKQRAFIGIPSCLSAE